MISGFIIIAIILLFFLIGIKRGIAITILNIAGLAVTAVAAYYIADFLSEFVYDTFLKKTVIENIDSILTQNGAEYLANNYLTALPEWLCGLVTFVFGLFGMGNGSEYVFSKVTTSDITHNIEGAVKNAAVSVIYVLIYIIFLILIFIFVKLLIKKLKRIFKLPVIKQANMFLGGVLGLAEGMIFVFFAVNIFYSVVQMSNPQLLSNELVSGNLFKFFCLFM